MPAIENALRRSRSAGSATRRGCWASTGSRWPTSTRRSAAAARCPTRRRAASCDSAFRGFSERGRAASRARSSTSGASTPSRGPASAAAPSARPSPRTPSRTCCSTTPTRLRDLMTIAHELGHGMHFALLQPAPDGPLASTRRSRCARCRRRSPSWSSSTACWRTEQDAATRSALVRGELESGFATVFRQTMMARYEQDAYGAAGRGQGADARPAVRDLDRAQPRPATATRSSCRRATASAGATSRTSSTRASTPTPTRSRTSRAWCCTPPTASRARRSCGPYVDVPGPGRRGRAGRAAAGVRHRPDRRGHVGPRPRRDGAPARARRSRSKPRSALLPHSAGLASATICSSRRVALGPCT